MGARERFGATVAIWVAFAITASIIVGQIVASVPIRTSEVTLIGLVVTLAAAATISTWAVWSGWRHDAAHAQAKAKHAERRRVARLTEEMDAVRPYEADADYAAERAHDHAEARSGRR